jgi:hypothetical protein
MNNNDLKELVLSVLLSIMQQTIIYKESSQNVPESNLWGYLWGCPTVFQLVWSMRTQFCTYILWRLQIFFLPLQRNKII